MIKNQVRNLNDEHLEKKYIQSKTILSAKNFKKPLTYFWDVSILCLSVPVALHSGAYYWRQEQEPLVLDPLCQEIFNIKALSCGKNGRFTILFDSSCVYILSCSQFFLT